MPKICRNLISGPQTDTVSTRGVKKLGVPFQSWGEDHEPIFTLTERKFGKTREARKGRWQLAGHLIYYVCPWCQTVNRTDDEHLRYQYRYHISLWCSSLKCGRHLTIDFKRENNEP